MTDERIEVERTIAAEPAAIFRVLADPQGHVTIDSSGMLMDATGDPVTAVGDRFVVHMDREALNDYPMGRYDVTVVIKTFVPDREIAWTIEGSHGPADRPRVRLPARADRRRHARDVVLRLVGHRRRLPGSGIFPIIPESALRATLGILARTVARNARA